MKDNDIHFEPSADSKKTRLSTRKAPQTRGGFRHPGLVQTAHAGRDIAVFTFGIMLEIATFMILGLHVAFPGGLIAGLFVIDIVGALLWHSGTADKNKREALLPVAATAEDEEAVRIQRPRRFAWINALGFICIVGPCFYKSATVALDPDAWVELGAMAPALLVSYIAIAVIHFTVTGFALAQLRTVRAEKKERDAMLRSSELPVERRRHPNHVKAFREYHFQSPLRLNEVENVDQHSLKFIGTVGDNHNYIIRTHGRFWDSQLAAMIARQGSPAQMAVLYRAGLLHELEIEESDVLAAADEVPGAAPASANRPVSDSSMPTKVAPVVPPSFLPVAAKAAATVLAVCLPLLTSCEKKAIKTVPMTFVTAQAQAESETAALPDDLRKLMGPEKALIDQFIPTVTVVRLDGEKGPETQLFVPSEVNGAVAGGVQKVTQLKSPGMAASKLRRQLTASPAGLFGKTGNASADLKSTWSSYARTVAEGSVVIAYSSNPVGTGDVDLPGLEKSPINRTPEEVHATMEAVLKSSPAAKFVVLLNPPMKAQPQSVVAVAKTPEADETADENETSGIDETTGSPDSESEVKPQAPAATNALGTANASTIQPNTNSPVSIGGPVVIVHGEKGMARVTDQAGNPIQPVRPKQIGDVVPFEKEKARLNTAAVTELERILAELRAAGINEVVLAGSADPAGGTDLVEGLSQRRCNAVSVWLMERGIRTTNSIPNGADLVPPGAIKDNFAQYRNVRVFAFIQ